MVGPDREGRRVDRRIALPQAATGTLRAVFDRQGERTALARLHEAGALRLRLPRGAGCEAVLVNTGGGIVGGDRLAIDLSLAAGAAVSVSTVAAEKVYRAPAASATVATRLDLDAGAALDWLPQETILFDAARLERRFDVDMAADARLLAVETIVFGRLASGEDSILGSLHDRWRVRRGGRLLFADESRLDGTIGATLDRPAVGAGARAAALMLVVAPDAEARLDPVRAVLDAHSAGVEAGASAWDGLLVLRALARHPAALREAMIAVLVDLGRQLRSR